MKDEKEFIKEIERDKWKSVKDLEKEKAKLKNAVKNKYKKKIKWRNI